MTEADYADDLALFAYTPAQAEFLLYSRKQAAGGIDSFVNANKMYVNLFQTKRSL